MSGNECSHAQMLAATSNREWTLIDVNRLGAEYKESSGENERYRAMFIIDRSIPVGFRPGEDLNARDTVIFERFYQ